MEPRGSKVSHPRKQKPGVWVCWVQALHLFFWHRAEVNKHIISPPHKKKKQQKISNYWGKKVQ